jgi:hypothetical protein
MDLCPHLTWDLAACRRYIHAVQPAARIFELSAKTGDGMAAWCHYLQHLADAMAPKQANSVVEISPLAFLNEVSHYSNDINKDHEKVDVLLTPVSPSHPWLLTSAETLRTRDHFLEVDKSV